MRAPARVKPWWMLEVLEETLEVNRVIAGKYRLERQLGQGGMGVVWAATDLSGAASGGSASSARVALKFLRSDREDDPKNRARFVREAKAALAVVHRNVAKVHAVLDTPSGMPFLVMDLLEGESLRTALRRKKILTVVECARIFVPITQAVEAAHALGIVHRDLKPENVFLVDGHDVRVLDFGIAKQMPLNDETASVSLTSTGAVVGTPHYMAPEQIYGDEDLDGRADTWALGIMLYECLSGARPFEGIGFGPLIRAITVDPIAPLHTKQPGLPLSLTRIVDRMLSRAREDRPSLEEVRAGLARAANTSTSAPLVQYVQTAPIDVSPTRVDPTRTPITNPTAPLADPQRPSREVVMIPATTTVGVASRHVPEESTNNNTSTNTRPIKRWRPITAAVVGLLLVGTVGTFAGVNVYKRTIAAPLITASGASASASADLSPPPPVSPMPSVTASDAVPQSDENTKTTTQPTATGSALPADTSKNRGGASADARQAFEKKDGVGCLRAFDEEDRLETDAARRSTDPRNTASSTRAMCMMLAGDCNGGKALYRAFKEANNNRSTAVELDLATDEVAERTCTGNALAPRDELRRAVARLHSTSDPSRRVLIPSAQCREWIASVRRLAGTVPPRAPNDDIGRARMALMRDGAACLARTGDCPGSFTHFRDEHLATRPKSADASQREKDIRSEYTALTDAIDACEGTPP